MIEMRIEDDDEGIEPSQRLRVLQPSVRGESRSAGGHGLGLALVARIAERHRGTVSIDSSHSLGGACVCIPLPESELTRDRLPDALQ